MHKNKTNNEGAFQFVFSLEFNLQEEAALETREYLRVHVVS